MKLLQEITEDVTIDVIEEEAGKGKSYFIEGIFLRANYLNKNKRMYPLEVMEGAVNKYITEHINENRAVGELGHPSSPIINYDRVSHKILSLRKEGNDFVGRAKILTNSPMGKIVMNLIDENIKFGVSSRGLGTIKKNEKGINEVQNDLFFSTAGDIVGDPSAAAFPQAIREGKEWICNNGIWTEQETDMMIEAVKFNKEEIILNGLQKLFGQ